MNYAIIKNGIVTNIIWLLDTNSQDFPTAVKIQGLFVSIGDTYNIEEDRFYHNGEPIDSVQEQLIDAQNALGLLGYTEKEAANG